MPEYTYHCTVCRVDYGAIIEPMLVKTVRSCPVCGRPMGRKPSALTVNWNGLKPSQGNIHPNIQQLINDAPRRRDEEHKP